MKTRHRWGGQTYTSHADKLKYDFYYNEWWKVTDYQKGMKVPPMAMNQPVNAPVEISHNNREMDKIGRAWQNTSKTGQVYLRGFLEDGRQVLIFHNPQTNPDAPTWSINLTRYTDEEKATLAAAAAAERAAYEAQRQTQAPQAAQGQAPVQQAAPNPLQQPAPQAQPAAQAPPPVDTIPI